MNESNANLALGPQFTALLYSVFLLPKATNISGINYLVYNVTVDWQVTLLCISQGLITYKTATLQYEHFQQVHFRC